jgi:hypothetical protein
MQNRTQEILTKNDYRRLYLLIGSSGQKQLPVLWMTERLQCGFLTNELPVFAQKEKLEVAEYAAKALSTYSTILVQISRLNGLV